MTPFSIHDPSIRSPKAACVVVVAAIGGNSSGHAAEKVVFEFCNGNRQTAFVCIHERDWRPSLKEAAGHPCPSCPWSCIGPRCSGIGRKLLLLSCLSLEHHRRREACWCVSLRLTHPHDADRGNETANVGRRDDAPPAGAGRRSQEAERVEAACRSGICAPKGI